MDRLKSWIITVKSRELHDMALTTLCFECIRFECIRMVDTSHCFFSELVGFMHLRPKATYRLVKSWLINHFEKYFTF